MLFFFSPPSLLLAHPFSFHSFRGTIFKLIGHKNLFFGLFQSYGFIFWLHFQINILTKKKEKKQQLNRNEVTYCRRTGIISSIHDIKSQFPLSIFIILGILQVIDWIQQQARKIQQFHRKLQFMLLSWKLIFWRRKLYGQRIAGLKRYLKVPLGLKSSKQINIRK